MINEERKKTQNDAAFVAFYDMRAVTFVLPDEMANVSIAGLQWFILIPRLKGLTGQIGLTGQLIPILYPIYIEKTKYRIWNKNYPACCNPAFLPHRCPLFRQWLCGKAASGLERILCGVMVNTLPDILILGSSNSGANKDMM